ncbi:MAG: prolipoprotein diacylglyceryl transferase [Ignavibacteriae bacterium]|nr:prolipoprotein diacylglyceryl transferase [Ignavibacteriota bacterium]
MYPKLFEIGPVPVYSYGLMLGLAFLAANYLVTKELKRYRIDENVGLSITFISIIAGLLGSKLFYIIEEWNFGKGGTLLSYFRADVLFSPSGLTFYGGLILAFVIIWIYCKRKNLYILLILDALAPATILGYGIARIGCHLSGDGCYGIPVNGTVWEFLGYSYSKGIVPTHQGVLVHPTSLYELAACVLLFAVLWGIRKKMKYMGQLFFIYLVFNGLERFLIEFIRLNPIVFSFFTQAQIISLGIFLSGVILLYIFRNQNNLNLQSGETGKTRKTEK